MSFHWNPREQVRTGRFLLKWTILASGVGVIAGSASALFLVSLEYVTGLREQQAWLLYLLPVAGCSIALVYHHFGKGLESGNNLLIDEIHKPQSGVPGKLAPLILVSTILTHLFGGSAGREGTAVQMGGSFAGWLARRLGLSKLDTRLLLMAGISAGFGSVFGTPLAGMVFGLEVLALGRIRYEALIPCLVASLVGDWTCTAWGVQHTPYRELMHGLPPVNGWLVGKVVLASMLFALASLLFAELHAFLHHLFKRLVPWGPGRPILGGCLVIALVWLLGTRDYLGLGVPLIVQSFTPAGVVTWAFAWKLLFTAVTLSCGFKGGEVTPLFFIGAALGCTLGKLLGVPLDFMAALGFVAVFAGAANTPLACTVMGIELFGAEYTVFLAIACCSAYIWSGHRGIYLSQVVDTPKIDDSEVGVEPTLALVRNSQPPVVLSLDVFARLHKRFSRPAALPLRHCGEMSMKSSGKLHIQKIGMVRIYLTSNDRKPGKTWVQRLFARAVYHEIIDKAREDGLWGASAKALTYGFTNYGKSKAAFSPDLGWDNTQIFVELISPRHHLEAFIASIQPLIEGRVTTYTDVEHWGPLHIANPVPDEQELLHVASEVPHPKAPLHLAADIAAERA